MPKRAIGLCTLALFALLGSAIFIDHGQAQKSSSTFSPAIPKTWDEEELAAMTLPSAKPGIHIVYVSTAYYYSIPVPPIYKSYPVYHPGKEPSGYLEWLKQQEPEEIVFDASKLKTEADWIKAGALLFDSQFEFEPLTEVRDPAWYAKIGAPLTKEGILPMYRYTLRKKGTVTVSRATCAYCHTRVLPDGIMAIGAQGNFPVEGDYAYRLRRAGRLDGMRKLDASLIFPALRKDDLNRGLYTKTADEVAAAHEAMIPGVVARPGFSVFDMPKTADLIGVKERKYLDLTARLQHRSIGDLMRYAAFCAGTNYFFSSTTTLPPGSLPDPASLGRFSDEQLYALALYIYSLRPPPNPNKFNEQTARGQAIFQREGCVICHTPPLYTNNKLTPAGNFQVPDEHRAKYDILDIRVGTDEQSALTNVRGRGYYKVPSLKGVWYRGPFEHNGSVATLEDWFDPKRLRDDYAPTGFKGHGVKTRAVKGHEFGLQLSVEDKRALIAFLKTL